MKNTGNIFSNIPNNLPEEIFETILSILILSFDIIVSKGQSSPKNFWYDQDQNEWVIVLEGKARLVFKGNETINLNKGDYINIPAHKKHRVEWTDPHVETIWLAIYY